MRRSPPAAALILFLAVAASAADAPYRTAEDRPVDVLHLKLDVAISLEEKRLSGTATIDFSPLRSVKSITLDAVDHDVRSIAWLGGDGSEQDSVTWENSGKELSVIFPHPLERESTHRLVIDYKISDPKDGLHFFAPSESEPNVPLMVWSQGEPIANRFWFPAFDHPNERQTTEVIATVPQGFEVVSNGRLVSREIVAGGKERFHWRQDKPHVAYLVTLVAGRFAVVSEDWKGRPVVAYAPPERAADVARTFGRTREMIDLFSTRFGIEYPWDKYAQVVVEQFVVGGMENTSATTLNQRVMHDERALIDSTPDWLIAHELGHQWWGDLVTCKDWSHLWLNEGFASYCEVLWAEYKLGIEERDYYLYRQSEGARSDDAKARPIVDRLYPHPDAMFDNRAYSKGSWVLHMLRHRLGDDDFFQALKRYGTVYAYQTAETSDLRGVFERLTGRSLERFFYDWTERPGHPVLLVESAHESESGLMRISIKQEQDGDAFQFPLRIELVMPEGQPPVSIERDVTEKESVVYLPVATRPLAVRVDPEFTLLAELKEEKSRDWWVAQLKGPTVAERIRAVEHFAKSHTDVDRNLLVESLGGDAFYGVRVEAAKGLGESGGDVSRDALVKGLDQEHPKVRRGCAEALGKFADDEKAARALAAKLETGDESYFVEGAAITALAKTQKHPQLDPLLAALDKPSHNEVIRRSALAGLGSADDAKALDVLLEWTKRDKPRDCRVAALDAAARFLVRNDVSAARREAAVETITGYLRNEKPNIRQAAAESLRDFSARTPATLDALQTLADHDPDWGARKAAMDAVEKLTKDALPRDEFTRLQKEGEQLRERNRDLEDRLRKLEAKF